MKKLYFILFVLFIGTNIYSQGKDQTAASEVIETIYDKTTEAVKQLAEALTVPAEHVYKVLVYQQKVISISYLIFYIFTILLTVFYYKYTLWTIKKNEKGRNKYDYSNGEQEVLTIVLTIFNLICWVLLFCTIDTTISGLTNPEYGAIKEIMSLF